MPAKAFVIAMAADIARSDYARPTLVRSRSREWLIACRWGPDGEYLSIATAGRCWSRRGCLRRVRLRPIDSLLGVLARKSETAPPHFLLTRQLPLQIELPAPFSGRRLRIVAGTGDLSLVCEARYSHSCGWLDGREVRKDIPDPAPSSTEAMAWHIEAQRCGWIGEFISGSMLEERRVMRAAG